MSEITLEYSIDKKKTSEGFLHKNALKLLITHFALSGVSENLFNKMLLEWESFL